MHNMLHPSGGKKHLFWLFKSSSTLFILTPPIMVRTGGVGLKSAHTYKSKS